MLTAEELNSRPLLMALYQAYHEAPGYVQLLGALRAETALQEVMRASTRRIAGQNCSREKPPKKYRGIKKPQLVAAVFYFTFPAGKQETWKHIPEYQKRHEPLDYKAAGPRKSGFCIKPMSIFRGLGNATIKWRSSL